MTRSSWVFLLVGGAVLWLAARGRLADVVYAMEHGDGESHPPTRADIGTAVRQNADGSIQGGGASLGPPAQSGSTAAGFPNPGLFGLTNVTSYALGERFSSGVAQMDQAGLTYAGGGQLAHDYDYGLAADETVRLPAWSQGFRLLKQYFDAGAGWIEAWTPIGGQGVFEYVHLSQPSSYAEGARVGGGRPVGVSGQPLSSANGYGKHLAVIVDTAGDRFLHGG